MKGDLSKNLSRHEFACKCGCGFDTVDVETLTVIQDACDHFDCRVLITSGCRCVEHNKKVGGAKGSKHLQGRAADCKFSKVEPAAVYHYLTTKYPERYGFGLYPTFVHIDTRSGAPWRQG
jgi:uncharacterized protein YcbK (DUF882 family)